LRVFRRALVVVLFAAFAPILLASDLEQQLHHEYAKKVLVLRGFYEDGVLHYDAAGTLKHPGTLGSWTNSLIHIKSIHLQSDKVEIKGLREVRTFNETSHRFESSKTDLRVLITIDRDPSHDPDGNTVRRALATVFVGPQESLAAVVPKYWQWVFENMDAKGVLADLPAGVRNRECPEVPSLDNPCVVRDKINAPRAIKSPDSDYDEIARSLKLAGELRLSLVVDESGKPQRILITRPLGAGMDERAVDAVRHWAFEPATRDGKPVPVALSVDISFRLY
jgi:TonB family protein